MKKILNGLSLALIAVLLFNAVNFQANATYLTEFYVQGDIASDVADSGNPVKVGGKAKTYGSLPTAVTDADRVNGLFDRYGAMFVQPGSPNVRCVSSPFTDATTSVALASAGSGEALRVYSVTTNIDYDATALVSVKLGFGTASVPATSSVLWVTDGAVPGNYPALSGIPVVGANGEDLRATITAPGNGTVNIITCFDLISI